MPAGSDEITIVSRRKEPGNGQVLCGTSGSSCFTSASTSCVWTEVSGFRLWK